MTKNLLFSLILIFTTLNAQNSINLCGVVISEEDNSPLPYAKVFVREINRGTLTDSAGKFCLKLPAKNINITLTVSFLGYKTENIQYRLNSQDTFVTIKLSPAHIKTQEVEIVYRKTKINEINALMGFSENIEKTNAVNTTQILEKIPAISLQTTTPSISRPFISGMTGPRIATVVDGIRLENQSVSADHGLPMLREGSDEMNAFIGPTIFPQTTGAIGGATFWNANKFLLENKTHVKFISELSSAYNGTKNILSLKTKNKLLDGINITAGYQLNNNTTLPNNDLLNNSGARRLAVATALKKEHNSGTSFLHFRLWNDLNQIPNTDSAFINEITTKSFETSQRQKNTLLSYNYKLVGNKFYWNPTVGMFINEITEQEEGNIHLKMKTHTYSLSLPWFFTPKSNITYNLGTYISAQSLQNKGHEILIPKYNKYLLSIPVGINVDKDKFAYNFKGRVSITQIAKSNFKTNYITYESSAGIIRKWEQNIETRIEGVYASRTPHPVELFSNGEHLAEFIYIQGDSSLKPEQIMQFSILNEVSLQDFYFILNFSAAKLYNWIIPEFQNDTLEGLPHYKFINIDGNLINANLFFAFHPHFAHWLHVEGKMNFTKFLLPSGYYLYPQPSAKLKLQFEKKFKKTEAKVFISANYLGKMPTKTLLDEYSNNYLIYNAGIILRKSKYTFSFGCQNLLDEIYYNIIAPLTYYGIPGVGRNFYVRFILDIF